MKMIIRLLALLMVISVASCKKETDVNPKKALPKQTKTREVKEDIEEEERPKDSINKKNVRPFLTLYGAENKETKVRIKTRLGNITLKLYEDTPLHRASFIFLSKMGYFDTTCFYRVVPNFIIQGGESERLDTQNFKAKYRRYKIPPEFQDHRKHKYGAIALARDWVNNPQKYSTAFEFYIVQNKKGAHHLDGEHTVFGEVTSGFATIDKIVALEAGSDEWPLEDVFMKVEVLE